MFYAKKNHTQCCPGLSVVLLVSSLLKYALLPKIAKNTKNLLVRFQSHQC